MNEKQTVGATGRRQPLTVALGFNLDARHDLCAAEIQNNALLVSDTLLLSSRAGGLIDSKSKSDFSVNTIFLSNASFSSLFCRHHSQYENKLFFFRKNIFEIFENTL